VTAREPLEPWDVEPAVARRLVELGACGVGGFVELPGEEPTPELPRLARRRPTRTAEDLVPGERWAWREALAVVRDLAGALRACEARSLAPGALAPRGMVLAPGVWVAADELVAALTGRAGVPEQRAGAGAMAWWPPAQADGAPWDAAANRYVLGLLAYRLLAGVAPFGGAGLRHALGARGEGAPAPFEDAVARALPPGVQTLVLAMLDPVLARRPATAERIAARCRELLEEPPGHGVALAAPPAPRRPRRRGDDARLAVAWRAPGVASVAWIAAPALVALVALGALGAALAPSAGGDGGGIGRAVGRDRAEIEVIAES